MRASLPSYEQLKEVSLFLLQQLAPAAALGLYLSVGGADWQYRGFVSNGHPSGALLLLAEGRPPLACALAQRALLQR